MRIARVAVALALLAAAPPPDPVAIPVTVAADLGDHQSGRLIVFAKRIEPGAKPDVEIDATSFGAAEVSLAAREVDDLGSGKVALVDGESGSFPAPFSSLPPGLYRLQAVLDRNHNYNYGGRGAGDLVSDVVEVSLPGRISPIALTRALRDPSEADLLALLDSGDRAVLAPYLTQIHRVDFVSPALSAFWARPIHVRGWIALPPGYRAKGPRFPTAYSIAGFGSTDFTARVGAARMMGAMTSGGYPPMLWVFLDESSATGTHEFADSANNGPWGQALTAELIPALERQYRMDARSSGRFLTGHSSGGWASLWLQIRYPKIFGGTWPTAPDPSDFHDFTNVDLYAPDANVYRNEAGAAYPVMRQNGKVLATYRQFAHTEAVLGAYGGQFASFEWVFSPKGADGRPMPMFDRSTGAVDAAVVTYWRDHYDIAHIVERDWQTLKPDLDGKIHMIVGTADTFYLDGPARRFKAVLDGLGAKSDFRFVPDRTHGNLLQIGDDSRGLLKKIAWEMYAIARPGAKRATN